MRKFTTKSIPYILIFVIPIFLLTAPTVTVSGARYGLLLWYESILPTLLPFIIITNVTINSGLMEKIQNRIPRSLFLIYLFGIGLFFGFPMGAKLANDSLNQGILNQKQAQALMVTSNHMSMPFIYQYLLIDKLGKPEYLIPLLLCLYVPSFIYLMITTNKYSNEVSCAFSHKKPTSRSQINFKIIDAGIMNGFETIVKLGCYIMLFSIAEQWILVQIPALPTTSRTLLCLSIEIVRGIHELSVVCGNFPNHITMCLLTFFLCFGGLSGMSQTSSIIQAPLSIRFYVKQKLYLALVSTLCMYLCFLCGFIV